MKAAEYLDTCQFGDVRAVMRQMIADGVKVQTIVTSPPYWGLRSYLPASHPDKQLELGSEPTFGEFLKNMVEVFDLCHQLLRADGTLWLNMGDSYASNAGGYDPLGSPGLGIKRQAAVQRGDRQGQRSGLKPKDLVGQPRRLAFALQDAGWYLRQDIIWSKPNPMPESIRDRCTKAHEYMFLLSKNQRYYYDFEAMQEPVNGGAHARRSAETKGEKRPGFGHGFDAEAKPRYKTPDGWATHSGSHGSFHRDGREKGSTRAAEDPQPGVGKRPHNFKEAGRRGRKLAEAGSGTKLNTSYDAAIGSGELTATRNRRSVWTVPSEPFSGAHFATFPTKLIEPCILAGAPVGGIVFDPFFGSGTTGQVAQALGRHFIGIDLNRANQPLQADRLKQRAFFLEAA